MAAKSQGRQLNRSFYTNSSLAYNLDVTKELKKRPSGEPLRVYEGQRKKEQKMSMSFMYVLYLAGVLVVLGYALISYLNLQSDITNLVDNISGYEQTLNNLTLANEDEYSKMINTVDYDEIRKIAIEELGMVYASEDQIVTYTRENSDYVRQLNGLSD